MRKIALLLGVPVLVVAVVLGLVAARHEDRVRPGTSVGLVEVGGLTRDEAARKLRVWWEMEKRKTLTLQHDALTRQMPAMTPGELGLALDDQASVELLPYEDFLAKATRTVGAGSIEAKRFDPVFRKLEANYDRIREFLRENAGRAKPARVAYEAGAIVREPEVSGYRLDEERLPGAVVDALYGDRVVRVPLEEAPKRIPDEALRQIKEVVAEFSTSFPASQYSRNTNIRLAASRLDGVVLMPGENVSFNETVGRRTIKDGFKEAGVYLNGRHDVGVGGGICQVSTTLYNAALFANLKIAKRQNHSMPVPYVPVGRDATVDYGVIDLVLENSYESPIAITSEYKTGRLFFRVLGIKDPSMEVKIVASDHTSWDRGEKVVEDPALAPGKRVVEEKGSRGHSVYTFRVVYRNGVEVAREPLGKSHYRGAERIIRVGPAGTVPEVPEAAPPASGFPSTVPPIGG